MCKYKLILIAYKEHLVRAIRTSPMNVKQDYVNRLVDLIAIECMCEREEDK